MSFRFDTVQEEDEWEIITTDWWRTAFISVPWTYVPSDVTKEKSLHRQFHGSLFAGLSQCARHSDDVLLCKFSENDTLNLDLVGVCSAMAAVTSYEEDVGFSYSVGPTIEPHELNLFTHVDLSINIDESDLLTGRQRWKELVDDLMNGESDLTLSSVDFSSSDGSIDSFVMPSTPKPKHIFTDFEVKVSSPNGSIDGSGFDSSDFLPPGKSLNAAASSFVPTFYSQSYEAVHLPPLIDASKSSSPTLSFATFTFPTLNASPQATVRLEKDEQGFFTEVQKESSNPGEPDKLLPPFLQESPHRIRSRKSRTREIVDRLRSTTSLDDNTTDPFPLSNGVEQSQKYASHSPSPLPGDRSFMIPRLSVSEDGDRASGLSTPSEDDDGWISQPNTLSSRHKARRTRETRELFLALTRRRTDSLSSENLKALLDSTYDSSPRNTVTSSTPPSPSPPPQTPPPLTSNDGWIESNPPLPKSQKKSKSSSRESHRRKKSSTTHNSSSRASLSTPSTSSSSYFPVSSSTTTSACLFSPPSPPHHHHSTISPRIIAQPQAIPYFFSAVATPLPYTAFMHFPAFPISLPMHGHAGLPVNNGVSTPYVTSPALITRRAGSVKPLMPIYRG